MNVDMVCSLNEIGVTTVQQLELLGPFGMGNPTPKVIISNAAYKELRTIGKEQQHVKITLKTSKDESAATLDAVGFHKSALLPWISSTAAMDVLGELSINEWNGVRKPQVMIQDLRIAHMQLFDWRGIAKIEPKLAELAERVDGRSSGGDARAGILMFHANNTSMLGSIVNKLPVWVLAKENGNSLMPANELAGQSNLSMVTDMILFDLPSDLSSLGAALSSAVGMERVYAIFYQGGTVYEGALPSRDMFKTVYGAVQQQAAASPSAAFIASLSKRSGLSSSLIQFMLDVFTEVGLITQSAGSYRLVVKPDKKISLNLRFTKIDSFMSK